MGAATGIEGIEGIEHGVKRLGIMIRGEKSRAEIWKATRDAMPGYILEGSINLGFHSHASRVIPDITTVTLNSWLSRGTRFVTKTAWEFWGFGFFGRAWVGFYTSQNEDKEGGMIGFLGF